MSKEEEPPKKHGWNHTGFSRVFAKIFGDDKSSSTAQAAQGLLLNKNDDDKREEEPPKDTGKDVQEAKVGEVKEEEDEEDKKMPAAPEAKKMVKIMDRPSTAKTGYPSDISKQSSESAKGAKEDLLDEDSHMELASSSDSSSGGEQQDDDEEYNPAAPAERKVTKKLAVPVATSGKSKKDDDDDDDTIEDEVDELANMLVGIEEKAKGITLPVRRKYKRRNQAAAPSARETFHAPHHNESSSKRAKTSSKNSSVMLPLSKEEKGRQVSSAAALVSRSLVVGTWPSPYRSFKASESTRNSYEVHHTHMSMVGASLEKFANDVIKPALTRDADSAKNQKQATNESANQPPKNNKNLRVFLASLVMFRELLCQNAGSIFGPHSMLTGLEDDFGDTKVKSANDTEKEEMAFFSLQVLATAIILTGLSDIGDTAEQVKEEFLDLVASYE